MKNVTLSEMKEEITKNDLVLVDVWASWCGPCKRMNPIFEDVDQLRNDVTILKVDADANPVGDIQVTGLPTMILFRNGVEVKRTTGAMPKLKLLKFIDE